MPSMKPYESDNDDCKRYADIVSIEGRSLRENNIYQIPTTIGMVGLIPLVKLLVLLEVLRFASSMVVACSDKVVVWF